MFYFDLTRQLQCYELNAISNLAFKKSLYFSLAIYACKLSISEFFAHNKINFIHQIYIRLLVTPQFNYCISDLLKEGFLPKEPINHMPLIDENDDSMSEFIVEDKVRPRLIIQNNAQLFSRCQGAQKQYLRLQIYDFFNHLMLTNESILYWQFIYMIYFILRYGVNPLAFWPL